MSINPIPLSKWHQDEKEWWDSHGEYMTYQWRLTPSLHTVIRAPLESDYINYLLKPGGRLLDLGCGSGWLSLYFAEQGMSVLGIDVSREQINAANELKEKRNVLSVDFECIDFIEWDIDKFDNAFDSVFVSAFIHHLPMIELEIIFQKIALIVKSGGRVFMYEPLTAVRSRKLMVKILDKICTAGLAILLDKLPNLLGLVSQRHKDEIARGYTMVSPHERPVDIDILKTFCKKDFEISEVKGWHLHSLGFSMQVTALKENVRKYYEPLGKLWYWIDTALFKIFGWDAFALPGRFILCGIKIVKK
jgi:2-polyprenyl-3-methyl-5-hydroxy-6-metoxy-1,4-benzoquinol methylase